MYTFINQNPTLPTKLSLRVIQNTLDNFQEIWEVGTKKQNVLNPLGVPSKKTNGIFKDIIQIEFDPPPSHPIFDKFIFDKVLIMLTSLPPLEFLSKIINF